MPKKILFSWNLAARGGCIILWLRQGLEHRLEFSSTSAITAQVPDLGVCLSLLSSKDLLIITVVVINIVIVINIIEYTCV